MLFFNARALTTSIAATPSPPAVVPIDDAPYVSDFQVPSCLLHLSKCTDLLPQLTQLNSAEICFRAFNTRLVPQDRQPETVGEKTRRKFMGNPFIPIGTCVNFEVFEPITECCMSPSVFRSCCDRRMSRRRFVPSVAF